MCDVWFTRADSGNPGGYRAWMPVDVTDDGIHGTCSERTGFFVIKIPGISKNNSSVRKYLEPHYSGIQSSEPEMVARRKWVLRGNDVPESIKDKFLSKGFIVVDTGYHTGEYDYTWQQVKIYLRNNATGLNETEDI